MIFPLLLFHPEGKTKKEKGAPIQRSTETGMAVELTRNMSRQPSRESNNGSMNSYNSEGKSVNHTPSKKTLCIFLRYYVFFSFKENIMYFRLCLFYISIPVPFIYSLFLSISNGKFDIVKATVA